MTGDGALGTGDGARGTARAQRFDQLFVDREMACTLQNVPRLWTAAVRLGRLRMRPGQPSVHADGRPGDPYSIGTEQVKILSAEVTTLAPCLWPAIM
jgi:hypothetical protein